MNRSLAFGFRKPIKIYTKYLQCFSTNQARQQFNRFFFIKIKYNSNAYYLTYSKRNLFRQQISSLQGEQGSKALIFGGHNFPMNQSTFVVNCDTLQSAQNFAKKNAFKGLQDEAIVSSEIYEMEKESTQKMRKLWQFYQMK